MNRNALIVAIILATGCSSQQPAARPEATASTPDTKEPITPRQDGQPCANADGYQLLPEQLVVPVAHHLRADRIYTNGKDQLRRRVVLEFLEGDVASALASVDSAMVAAGFNARPRREQPNGNTVIPYVRNGFGNITVVANPSIGDNPSHPAAKGILAFDFPAAVQAQPIVAPAAEASAG